MVLASVVVAAVAPAERVLVSVSGVAGDTGAVVSADATAAVAEVLAGYDVSSDRDIATAVEVEAQRQMSGCSDEACVAEIAGALGARFVLSILVVDVDGTRQAMATLHDTRAVQVVARSSRTGEDAVVAAAVDVARALVPSPLPLVFGVSAGVVGAAGVGAGVVALVFGIEAAGRDEALARVRDPVDAAAARKELERVETVSIGSGIGAAVALVIAAGFGVAAVAAP